ncbi:MAG: C4-type zinc ribbon domain-containing protein [Trueperaceae bacterium]
MLLDRLSDVQTRDLELDNLQEEKGRTPPELIETRVRQQGLEERLSKRRQERDELRKRVAQNELELKALDERRKAAVAAGLRADSSKEASQFQNQELQFATRVQELEEDTMPLLGDLESLDEDIAGLEGELSELEPVLTKLSSQENARLEELDSRMESLSGERNSLAKDIDSQLLRQYEQVRKARRGVGLVPVVSNQQCGGCNVKLPIHVVQKARKGGTVTRCPSCGRILWAQK